MFNRKRFCGLRKVIYNCKEEKKGTMIRTKSFKEYKRLKSKGFNVELCTKADLNK